MKPLLTLICSLLPILWGCAERESLSIDPAVAEAVTRSAWRDSIRAADDAYAPGSFTTFATYEYTTSTDDMGNLHRNVIFRDTDRLPAIPFSRFNSQEPEGLWNWMDDLRGRGIESLAIPTTAPPRWMNRAIFPRWAWSMAPPH